MIRKYDIEERLVKFAGEVILSLKDLPNDIAGECLSKQLVKSATSSALNFGEFQAAESNRDKVHKLSISLKEMKETRASIKILIYLNYGREKKLKYLLEESDELAAILATIIKKFRVQH